MTIRIDGVVRSDLGASESEQFDVTGYGAVSGGTDTVNNAAFLAAITAANGEAVYVPDGTYALSLALTDLPVNLIGPGKLQHQQAKSVLTVTRTFGTVHAVSSIGTITLGLSSGGSPDAINCSRLNVASVAGFDLGTIVHITSHDAYLFSAQQSAGQSTYMAEMIRLTGVSIEYDGELNSGFAEGNTITGVTSGATARVVAVTDDGTTGKLLLTGVTGTFVDNENLTVGGVVKGVANGAAFLACAGKLITPFATTIEVRPVPEVLFKIDGPEIVCSGDQDSIVGTANRLPAVIMIGVTTPQIRSRVRSAWSRAFQFWSCWQGDIDLFIDSLPNNADLTEQAYGYGVEICGASFGMRVRVNGGNCRHAFTTNTTWASTFASVNYQKWGSFKGGLVYDSFVSGAKAAAFDTHAGGYGLTFDNCKASSGTPGGRYLTTGDGFHNRSFGTTYRNCQADTVRPFYDESSIYDSSDITGAHKITFEHCLARYGYIGFEVAAIPNGVSYTGVQDYYGCSAVGDGAATNDPYYQYGFHTGNGIEANYVACRSASFNGAPWGFEGFGKATLMGGCYADYTNAPAFASALRVNGTSQIVNVDGYDVRYQTSTSTPGALLRAAATAVTATFNIGNIACLNSAVPVLLLDAGSGTVVNYRDMSDGAMIPVNIGDASATCNPRSTSRLQFFNVALTANRTITLGTTQANNGDFFKFVRQAAATGNFTADIGGLISLKPGEWCIVRRNASAWVLESFGNLLGNAPYVLAQSGAAASVGAVTSEATLATITVPAGAMGANGSLRISTYWEFTGSTNSKTMKIKLGATTFYNNLTSTAANISWNHQFVIQNANDVAAQVAQSSLSSAFGYNSAAGVAGSENTAVAKDITITGQKASSGETLTLVRYTVEVLPF